MFATHFALLVHNLTVDCSLLKLCSVTNPLSICLGLLTDNRFWRSHNPRAVIEDRRDSPKLSVLVLYVHTKIFLTFLVADYIVACSDIFLMLILVEWDLNYMLFIHYTYFSSYFPPPPPHPKLYGMFVIFWYLKMVCCVIKTDGIEIC
jgi:hypothetical protein